MKWTKLQLILALLVSVFIFNACKDDPVNPPDSAANYFQFKTGNYWIYKSDSLATDGSIITGTSSSDSTIVTGLQTKSGKSAYSLITYYSDGNIDSSYYAVEGSKLYSYFGALSFDQFNLDIGKWLILADYDGTTWTVLDTNITVETSYGQLVGKLTMSGSKGTNKTIAVGSENISCLEFIHTLTLTGKIASMFDVSAVIKIKYYLGKNIGLVQIIREPTTINASLIILELHGYNRSLQRYKVTL